MNNSTSPYEWRSHQFALRASEWSLETTSGPEEGWEWCHTPLPAREQGVPSGLVGGGEGVWLPRDLHQIHGILQSEDVGRPCFWVGDAKRWLETGPFVEGWFDLYDLYEKWACAPRGPHDNGRTGTKHTKETKEKQSIAKRGKPSTRKGVPNSPEANERIRVARNRVLAQKKLRSMAANDPLLGAFWD